MNQGYEYVGGPVDDDYYDRKEAWDDELPSGSNQGEACTFAMLCHLSGLIGSFVIPLGNIIGPLVFWLIKKDEYPFVDDQGKEALNFQISMFIYMIGAAILCIVLIGIPILIGLVVAEIVLGIMGTIAASKGERYRYPMTIHFLR